jgi:hypothetical protein
VWARLRLQQALQKQHRKPESYEKTHLDYFSIRNFNLDVRFRSEWSGATTHPSCSATGCSSIRNGSKGLGSRTEAPKRKHREAGGSLGGRIALLADVQIFHEAVRVALQYNEFFKPEEIYRAKDLLRQGLSRADALALGPGAVD